MQEKTQYRPDFFLICFENSDFHPRWCASAHEKLLAKGLCGVKHRRSTRIATEQKGLIFVGLSEIIHALSTPDARTDESDTELPLANLGPIDWTKPDRFGLMLAETKSQDGAQHEERVLRSEVAIEKIILDEWNCVPTSWEECPALPLKDDVAQGDLINTGPRGYCVFVSEAEHPNIQIGVPIGIMEPGYSMFLGTVRWLMRDHTGFRFGIELMSPSAEVVEVQVFGGISRGKGLLLPADSILRPDPELLVQPAVFKMNTKLWIQKKNKSPQSYLGQIYEETPAFTRMKLIAALNESADT